MTYLARFCTLKRVMTCAQAGRAFGCSSTFIHSLCTEQPDGVSEEECWQTRHGWRVNGYLLAVKVPELGVRA